MYGPSVTRTSAWQRGRRSAPSSPAQGHCSPVESPGNQAPRSQTIAKISAAFILLGSVLLCCFCNHFLSYFQMIWRYMEHLQTLLRMLNCCMKYRNHNTFFHFSLIRMSNIGKFMGRTCFKINHWSFIPQPPKIF